MAKTLGSLPTGSKVKDLGSKYYGKDIIFTKIANNHPGYPANSVTLITEKIMALKASDAKEPNKSEDRRKSYGNNRHIHSNIRRWLNSDKASWYTAQHGADAPPNTAGVSYNPYDTESGFLTNLTTALKNAILNTSLEVEKNPVDGGGKESFTNKIFLLSRAEAGLGGTDGTPMAYFDSNTKRLCNPTAEAVSNSNYTNANFTADKPWYWWLRTPHSSSSDSGSVYHVHSDGSRNYYHACYGSRGVRPALNLPSSILVSDTTDADGCYVIQWNSSPAISGQDENLGDKNTGFTISYSVNDADVEDKLTVKEKINGVTIRTLNNAPRNENLSIEITEEMLFSYNLHTTNTIEIEVSDGQGHVVYRRYTFKRTNTAPKISGQDADLGGKTEGFDITFSATDQENDRMVAKIYLNDKLVQTYETLISGQEYTYSLSKLEFVQLGNTAEHKVRIEVQDHNNATAIRNYTFTRKIDRIMYAFKKETDIMAKQILISPTWFVAEGAIAKVLVCNNALDAKPTWEDATEQLLLERHFNFTNTAKISTKWGIGVQITIKRGTAKELSYLAGFGGAYK